MERYARLGTHSHATIRRALAVVTLASLAALLACACGERRPCNAPVKSLDAADSTAPIQ